MEPTDSPRSAGDGLVRVATVVRRRPNQVAVATAAALVTLWEVLHPHPGVALGVSGALVLLNARIHDADQSIRTATILYVPAVTATLHAGPAGAAPRRLGAVEVAMLVVLVALGALGSRRAGASDDATSAWSEAAARGEQIGTPVGDRRTAGHGESVAPDAARTRSERSVRR